jgi:hypothetical protein
MAALLVPHCEKKDTKYQKAIPMRVRVACTLYKLVHGASLLICSELFAMGKSIVSAVLHDVVQAVNMEFRFDISFPRRPRLNTVMSKFHDFCGLPRIVGVIDETHIHILKPFLGPEDYFYFKTSNYNIQMQAVVDRCKKNLDVTVEIHGSTHDSQMLRQSSLYQQAESGTLFDLPVSFKGFTPYLLGVAGYPLKQWLLTLYRDGPGRAGHRSILERLFNKRLSWGCNIIENAFGILKQSFQELLDVTDLHVTFVPDAVVCCYLVHNVLLSQDPANVARLLEILQRDGMIPLVDDDSILDLVHEVEPK